MTLKTFLEHNSKKMTLFLVCVSLFFLSDTAYATAVTLGSIASHVTSAMSNLAKLVTALSYVAGFGFAAAGVLKFKAHKDNPTQIPLSAAVMLLFVGIALIFLPAIFGATGKTLFNSTSDVGGVGGVTTFT